MLVLNVAESLIAKRAQIVVMRALPCMVVGRSESLEVIRGPGKGEHGNRFTYPNLMPAQVFLKLADLSAIVMLGEDEVRLYPRYALACMDKKNATVT